MTTPYAVSTNIGSMSYNNYVNAPITGPLSTNQYPCILPVSRACLRRYEYKCQTPIFKNFC